MGTGGGGGLSGHGQTAPARADGVDFGGEYPCCNKVSARPDGHVIVTRLLQELVHEKGPVDVQKLLQGLESKLSAQAAPTALVVEAPSVEQAQRRAAKARKACEAVHKGLDTARKKYEELQQGVEKQAKLVAELEESSADTDAKLLEAKRILRETTLKSTQSPPKDEDVGVAGHDTMLQGLAILGFLNAGADTSGSGAMDISPGSEDGGVQEGVTGEAHTWLAAARQEQRAAKALYIDVAREAHEAIRQRGEALKRANGALDEARRTRARAAVGAAHETDSVKKALSFRMETPEPPEPSPSPQTGNTFRSGLNSPLPVEVSSTAETLQDSQLPVLAPALVLPGASGAGLVAANIERITAGLDDQYGFTPVKTRKARTEPYGAPSR